MKNSSNGEAMRKNQSLYKGGAVGGKHVTISVDALVIAFDEPDNLIHGLLSGNLAFHQFTYRIYDTTDKNHYTKLAKFYYGNILLGNLFFGRKSFSPFNKRSVLNFRFAKERFYSNEDWLLMFNEFKEELKIIKHTIARLDVAVDVAEDLVPQFEYYLTHKYKPNSGAKRVSRTNGEDGNVGSIRYALDEGKKVIAIYKKHCSGLHLSANEEKLTSKEYKQPNQFQIDYWQHNGLTNINFLTRIELRLLTYKYTKGIELTQLQSVSQLAAMFFSNIGQNLIFTKAHIENGKPKPKKISLLDKEDLVFKNEKLEVAENVVFKLTTRERDKIKFRYQTGVAKVIKTISSDTGIVDIGDGFRVEITHNYNKKTLYHTPYYFKNLFDEEVFNDFKNRAFEEAEAAIQEWITCNPELLLTPDENLLKN